MINWYCFECQKIISFGNTPNPKHQHIVFGFTNDQLFELLIKW